MKTLQPITTNFGKNLSMLISLIGIRHKEASEQIGISYNTLSNIVNNNFNPSEETINKIESFVTKKGFDKSMLYIVRKPIRNFRIRIKKTLSGNEKATLRNTLIEIEKLINYIDKLELENKPKCALIGADGNIFNLMGMAFRTLKHNGMQVESKEIIDRVTNSKSYSEALSIIGEYVEITDEQGLEEDEEYE